MPIAAGVIAHSVSSMVRTSLSRHFVTRYREMCTAALQMSIENPALRFNSPRNSFGSRSVSHTGGRNVARLPANSSTTPSTPGRSCASNACSPSAIRGSGADSRETSTDVSMNSSVARRGKRGSSNAAATALARTSTPSGRRASSVPMQPRSKPCLKSVTKVAPGASSSECPGSALSVPKRSDPMPRTSPSSAPMARRAIVTSERPSAASCIDGFLDLPCRDTLRCLAREGKRGIADDPRFFARGIAGVAQVEKLRLEAMPARAEREAVDRRGAARLLVIEGVGEPENVLDGGAIDLGSPLVRMVVRQVGADHDQRLGPAPDALDDFLDFRWRCVPDRERNQGEIFEHRLQERKLHFE